MRPSPVGGCPRPSSRIGRATFKPTSAVGEADYQHYARRLGIELVYARRARTKGKIERLFRFIQQDFVLEHLEATSVAAVNAAFAQWIEAYNFGHASRALRALRPSRHPRGTGAPARKTKGTVMILCDSFFRKRDSSPLRQTLSPDDRSTDCRLGEAEFGSHDGDG